jgi:hypothetical protein
MSDIETVQQVKIGKDQIMILNKNNYVEWRESFENLSMNYSEAGALWRTRIEPVFRAPNLKDAKYNGIKESLVEKMFMRDYDMYDKRIENFKVQKQALCGLMMSSLSKDMNERMRGDETFPKIWNDFDLVKLSKLIELHATGKGSTSIYMESARMIKMEQGKDTFAKYAKNYKDTVIALKAKGTPEDILDSIIDSKFILGVDQEKFKTQLSFIFSQEKWPKLQDAIDMFNRFTDTRDNVDTMNNELSNGKITANVSKVEKHKREKLRDEAKKAENDKDTKIKKPAHKYICIACGRKGHHYLEDCFKYEK